jgi:hypothetical protein
MSREKIVLFINVIIILRHVVRAGKGPCAGQYRRFFSLFLFGADWGFRKGFVPDDLCAKGAGRGPDPEENEGGRR